MATLTPPISAGLEAPGFSRGRGAAAVAAMAVTVTLAALATRTITTGAGATPPNSWAITLAVAVVLVVSGGRSTLLAWRGSADPGLAGSAFGGGFVALLVAAILTGHGGYVLLLVPTHLAFHAICTINPPAIAEHLSRAWWTPVGAAREATALAVIDAADHAQNLLRDPRLDGASADQLVRVFVLDARAAAADTVGDARDTFHRTGRFVCAACGTDTETEPCARHQPFLHAERAALA